MLILSLEKFPICGKMDPPHYPMYHSKPGAVSVEIGGSARARRQSISRQATEGSLEKPDGGDTGNGPSSGSGGGGEVLD